jgi:hypothetical protein
MVLKYAPSALLGDTMIKIIEKVMMNVNGAQLVNSMT